MMTGNDGDIVVRQRMTIGAMTAAERSAGRYMRAPDEHGAGDPPPAAPVSDVFNPGTPAPPPPPPPAAPPAGDPPPWADIFSADAIDADTPSHREWLAAKGFKTADDIVKSYRETERALRSGSRIEMPKDGATPEAIAAYHRAIGVPEQIDGYVIKLPDGIEGVLDDRLVTSFKESALKAGVPASAVGMLGQWYIEQQLDMDAGIVAARAQETQAKFTEWGGEKDRNLAMCNRAAAKLGLDAAAVADLQKGFGAGRTLDLMLRLGQGIAEDALLDGGGRGKFGVTAAEATAERQRMLADPETAKKIRDGDPETTARLKRLQSASAEGMDQQRGRTRP
jgi:hypothetical protein